MPDLEKVGFSTVALSGVWAPEAFVRRLLEVEVALAAAGASVGVVPRDALARIEAAASEPIPHAQALLARGWALGTPVIPLVALLRERVGGEWASYVHLGATSQDVVDTAMVLQLRASFRTIAIALEALVDGLHALIVKHPRAWVLGTTLLQPALPMLFSLRVARWLDPLLRELERIDTTCAQLPIQLGGPVGDLASLGPHAQVIARELAGALRLSVPRLPWHTDRSVVVLAVELASAIARACATIAHNLMLLSQPEIGELVLGSDAGTSSSMPHKRNPHHAVRAISAAHACQSVSTVVTRAPAHELERAAGSWQAEWFALPLVMQSAGATVEATHAALQSARFDPERAAARVGPRASPPDAVNARLVEGVLSYYRTVRGPKTPWACE